MRPYKGIFILVTVFITLTFILPTVLVLPTVKGKVSASLSEDKPKAAKKNNEPQTEIAVFRSNANRVDTISLEDYVIGVVASEMPADFELEALKAQALAARTYIVNHLLHANNENIPNGADITDTQNHQVYKSKEELKLQWKDDFDWKYKKVKKAVQETSGKILTYKDQPITASFFSMSNGYTENAEDYWENKIPYLKSVESPWDSQSPRYETQTEMSIEEFENKLGVKISNGNDIGTITGRTAGKKVASVTIGGKSFTGREIREKLNLRSTDFNWVKKGNSIVITTKGFGHGVGMSQYGANYMAQEGKNYQDIIKHYYQGVDISKATDYIDKNYALN